MQARSGQLRLALLATLAGGSIAAIGALPHSAIATPAHNFNSVIVSRSFFERIQIDSHHEDGEGDDQSASHLAEFDAKDPSYVYVVDTIVPPGGSSGWHTHPGPSVVSVKKGTATVYHGNDPTCTSQTYTAGTGFIDQGSGHVHLVRNAGTVNLELIAFQIVPAGAARRIDVPDPGFCPSL